MSTPNQAGSGANPSNGSSEHKENTTSNIVTNNQTNTNINESGRKQIESQQEEIKESNTIITNTPRPASGYEYYSGSEDNYNSDERYYYSDSKQKSSSQNTHTDLPVQKNVETNDINNQIKTAFPGKVEINETENQTSPGKIEVSEPLKTNEIVSPRNRTSLSLSQPENYEKNSREQSPTSRNSMRSDVSDLINDLKDRPPTFEKKQRAFPMPSVETLESGRAASPVEHISGISIVPFLKIDGLIPPLTENVPEYTPPAQYNPPSEDNQELNDYYHQLMQPTPKEEEEQTQQEAFQYTNYLPMPRIDSIKVPLTARRNRSSNIQFKTAHSARAPPKKVEVPKEAIMALKNAAINESPIPAAPDEHFAAAIDYLTNEKAQHVIDHNFEKGQEITDAIDILSKARITQKKLQLYQQAQEQHQANQEQLERELNLFDAETESQKSELEADFNEQLKRITASHDEENEAVIAQWQTEAKLRLYNRASQSLIADRAQLKTLLEASRFEDARQLQNRISKSEAAERDAAHRQMQRDFEAAVESVRKRHDMELEAFGARCELQRAQLAQRREVLKQPLVRKQRRIEAEAEEIADPEKVWNRNQMAQKDELVATMRSRIVLPPPRNRAPKEATNTTISLPPLNFNKGRKILRPKM